MCHMTLCRYGNMLAQMRAFWDGTGGLWASGALHGKPFTAFTSTASQGGGQEFTIASCAPPPAPPSHKQPRLSISILSGVLVIPDSWTSPVD